MSAWCEHELLGLLSAEVRILVFEVEANHIIRIHPSSWNPFESNCETVVGDPALLERIHPDDLERLKKAIQQAAKEVVRLEFRITISKQIRWVGCFMRPHPSKPNHVQGFLRDIASRKTTEHALRSSGEHFKQILSRLPSLVLLFDRHQKLVFTNKEEVHLDETISWIHPDFNDTFDRLLKRCLQHGESSSFECKLRIHRPEFQWFHLHIAAVGRAAETDAMVICQNISERKRAEQILHSLTEDFHGQTDQTLFYKLTELLAKATQADVAIVSELKPDGRHLKTHAIYHVGEPIENFEYDIEGTPCRTVLERGLSLYPLNVQEQFPDDEVLKDLDAHAYVGLPLLSNTGDPIGVICCMYKAPLSEGFHMSSLSVFAQRAAQELTRIQNARELSEQRELYQLLFRSIQDAIILIRMSDFRVIAANPKACELYGYGEEEWEGLDAFSLSAEKNASLKALQNAKSNPFAPNRFKRLHVRKNGSNFPIESSLSVIELHGEKVVCALIRDVSKEKAQAEKIERSTRLLNQSQKAAAVGGWEYNPANHSLYLTHQMLEILEVDSDEPLDWQTFANSFTPAFRPSFDQAFHRLSQGSAPVDLDLQIFSAKKGTKWVRLLAKVSEGIFYGALQDIDRQKTMENQLSQAQKVESIGRLAGGVAHDFNNLLTTILGYSEMAKIQKGDELNDSLAQIHESAEKGAFLTRQLLGFARKQVSNPKAVELNKITRKTLAWLRRLLGEHIQLEFLPDENIPAISIDPSQFEQVILNLAINASDAMPEGGKLTLTTYLEIPHHVKGNFILQQSEQSFSCLVIQDSGEGIAPDVLPLIFEPFFTTKPTGKGTGLGLSNCYGIMKQNRGFIFADSEVGKGTAFYLLFQHAQEISAPVINTPEPAEPEIRGSEVILVVEDDELIREMVAEFLTRQGYTVVRAIDGQEALEIVRGKEREIDLLLTDVVMPRIGGPELAENLKAKHPEIKVLFTSGYTQKPLFDESGTSPPFLPKPFLLPDLVRKVREVLTPVEQSS